MCRSYMVLFCLLVQLLCIQNASAKLEPHIWCGACIGLIEDMKIQIETVNKKEKLDVGSFRLDATGKQTRKQVAYATSDLFLMGEFERLCNAMHYYGEATGNGGEKIIIRTSSYDGTSIAMKGIRKDDNLRRSLQYACETIIEEHEEEMLKVLKTYHGERSEVEKDICVTRTKLCSEGDLTTRMWTMGQAIMAGIQEKADQRLKESEENEEIGADESSTDAGEGEETTDPATPDPQDIDQATHDSQDPTREEL